MIKQLGRGYYLMCCDKCDNKLKERGLILVESAIKKGWTSTEMLQKQYCPDCTKEDKHFRMCKNCKHWEEFYLNGMGKCKKAYDIINGNFYYKEMDCIKSDDRIMVGPDFGCIHWDEKER